MTDNFSTTNRPKCPKCSGTGFDRPGHLCDCITKDKNGDVDLDMLKAFFGFGEAK
jgi:hypothetical protein